MKSVLVTGANGYIGRHVVDALKQKGAHVVAADLRMDGDTNADVEISCDIFDSCENILRSLDEVPDACLHLAWKNGFNHKAPSHIEDLSAHFEFLTSLAHAGVSQIAVMGSMHEVGYWEGAIDENTPCNPQSLYGVAKNALRQALELELADTPVVFQWIRGYYIYGDDSKSQNIFGKILQASEEGRKTFPFTSGKNKYDFLPIDELAYQIACVLMQDKVSGIINCCSGDPISLAEMVERFIADHGLNITLEYGVFPDRPYDSPGVWGDNTKIKSILNGTR